MEAASFTDFDSEVLAVQPPPFKDEIIAELLGTEDVNNDNDDTMIQLTIQLFNLMQIMLLA